MFSSELEEDNVTKNMAKEIVRDCGLAGCSVSLDLATYLIQLKFLIPVNGFKETKIMDRDFTQPLIDECVREILYDSVWMNILKLQVYSEFNMTNRESTKKDHEENVWKRSRSLMKEIIDLDPLDKDGRDKMYKKMVLFTVVFCGLGNAAFNSVVREAYAALQSIFKYSELERFIFLTDTLKEEKLVEFARITCGIRLFNRDCQKGGDNIDDLPLILTQASQITKEKISNTLEQLLKRIGNILSGFDKLYTLQTRRLFGDDSKYELPSEYNRPDVDKMRKIFTLLKEHEYYMRRLLGVTEETMSSVAGLIERFREILLQLHDIVRYRSAVPTAQVYPLFILLSHIWEEMQREASVLSEINSFMGYLNSFNKFEEQTQLEKALADEEPKAEIRSQILTNLDDIDRNLLFPKVTVICSPDESLFDKAELGGYCAWTLVAAEGLLVPGNPNLGFLKYKGKMYSFSSASAAVSWGKEPDTYLMEVYRLARNNLELVKILNLYNSLYQIKSDCLLDKEADEITLRNAVAQTETHPVKSYIDRDYFFSLWEFKRKALQLSHIINYQTTSQQTVNRSHFRASIGLQVSPSKSESTQTKEDNSCNHARRGSYLLGLRGQAEDKFQALDLTRPVDEDSPNTPYPSQNC